MTELVTLSENVLIAIVAVSIVAGIIIGLAFK